MPRRRPARFPASLPQSTTFKQQTSKPSAEQSKIMQPSPFPDSGAASKCDNAPQNLRSLCVLCGDSSTKTAKRAKNTKHSLLKFSIRVRTSWYEFVAKFIDDAPPQTDTGASHPPSPDARRGLKNSIDNNINMSILIQTVKLMESTINLEARLLALDREIHALLNMVREQCATKKKTHMVRETIGAWGYDIDSKKFVDNLRKSKRLDWVK